jgi:hypothetical protein
MVIGIDPGKSGGIVVLNNGRILAIDKMPPTPLKIWHYFISLGFPNALDKAKVRVVVEGQHPMPNDGKSSIWSFAKHIGHLEMALELLSVSYTVVYPITWIKWLLGASMGVKKEKSWSKQDWKRHLRDVAKEEVPIKWKNSITLATADAYWIALYGHKKLSSEPISEKPDVKVPIC